VNKCLHTVASNWTFLLTLNHDARNHEFKKKESKSLYCTHISVQKDFSRFERKRMNATVLPSAMWFKRSYRLCADGPELLDLLHRHASSFSLCASHILYLLLRSTQLSTPACRLRASLSHLRTSSCPLSEKWTLVTVRCDGVASSLAHPTTAYWETKRYFV